MLCVHLFIHLFVHPSIHEDHKTSCVDCASMQVPPVFAAARNALYSRYTDNDWVASNMSNYLASNRVRGASERVRHDTVTMCHELDDKTKRTQVPPDRLVGFCFLRKRKEWGMQGEEKRERKRRGKGWDDERLEQFGGRLLFDVRIFRIKSNQNMQPNRKT